MYKRIVFDLDGTLIDLVDFRKSVIESLNHFNLTYTEAELNNYMEAMKDYEEFYRRYDLIYYYNHLKRRSGINFDFDFIEYYLRNYKAFIPETVDQSVYETLEYLKSKYDLVVLTNFFRKTQIGRLRELNMDHYFSQVIGAEIHSKPDIHIFHEAANPFSVDDCLMIGDSYEKDYNAALNAGMDAILVSSDERYKNENKIRKIQELRKIL